jgi:hypothetical protein
MSDGHTGNGHAGDWWDQPGGNGSGKGDGDGVPPEPAGQGPAPDPNPVGRALPFKLCGARKRDGTPCRGAAMPNGRCRLHGGLTPAGPASVHYKHGRRSRYLKALRGEMKDAYKAALKDERLLEAKDEVALLEARVGELLGQLTTEPAPPWGRVVDALVACEHARARGSDKDGGAFAALARLIRTGADAARSRAAVWRELRDTIGEKTRTARVEHRRQLESKVAMALAHERCGEFTEMLLTAAHEVVFAHLAGPAAHDLLLALLQRTRDLIPDDDKPPLELDRQGAPRGDATGPKLPGRRLGE